MRGRRVRGFGAGSRGQGTAWHTPRHTHASRAANTRPPDCRAATRLAARARACRRQCIPRAQHRNAPADGGALLVRAVEPLGRRLLSCRVCLRRLQALARLALLTGSSMPPLLLCLPADPYHAHHDMWVEHRQRAPRLQPGLPLWAGGDGLGGRRAAAIGHAVHAVAEGGAGPSPLGAAHCMWSLHHRSPLKPGPASCAHLSACCQMPRWVHMLYQPRAGQEVIRRGNARGAEGSMGRATCCS